MQSHPFTKTIFHLLVCLLLFLVVGALLALLLRYYQDLTWSRCLLEGFVVTGLWGILFYYSWYISLHIKFWPAKVVAGVFLLSLHLAVCYLLFVPSDWTEVDIYLRQLPFLFIFGGLSWIILMQWYETQKSEERVELAVVPEAPVPVPEEKPDVLQTLPVKDGSRIHIIPVEEIFYIQACGDYVNIFTREGQFLKEQTMKSLEASLPASFIRIHRSTLINSIHLLRIELFGKENYHVQLKNGVTLKASLTGYKTLKSRLNL